MRLNLLGFVFVVGCACGAPGGPSGTTPAPAVAPVPSPPHSDAPPSYSVHEWGLMRAGASDTLSVGALGPEALPARDLQVVEKPVIYFHLAGAAPMALSVATATAVDGEIREHWPFTGVPRTPMPTSVAWGPLTIETERCGVSVPIDRSIMPCAALGPGEACESLELARVVSDDASCVRIGENTSPFLFYRSTSRGLTVPIRAVYLDFDDIVVTNTGTVAIPGRMLRFQRIDGGTRVLVFDPPAPGTTIMVNHAWVETSDARTALTETLVGLGLTLGEAAAFAASWDSAFFGPRRTAEDVTETPPGEHSEMPARMDGRERGTVEEGVIPDRPEDSVLYFLPPEMVDQVARLTFEPPPTEVRRAMAVWTAL